MNYKQTAQQLASKGRYGDSMLVHMTPKEVAGLKYLGSKYGAKMTVNPSTGLPEAFNFSRFLPMIAGAALAPYTGGASAALIVGGVETARTGNIMKGLQAGLGAYGGANIASGLGTMGAEQGVANTTAANLNTAGSAVGPTNVTGSEVIAAQNTPGGLEKFISQQAGGAAPGTEAYRLAGENYATAASEAASKAPANLGTPDFRPTYSDIGKGVALYYSPLKKRKNHIKNLKLTIVNIQKPTLTNEILGITQTHLEIVNLHITNQMLYT